MAISVAFGLLFVTVIILVLLPIYLLWINPLHRSWVWVKRGDWLSREQAEPAVREEGGMPELQAQTTGPSLSSIVPWLLMGGLSLGAALVPSVSRAQELSREAAVAMSLERNYGIRIARANADLAASNDAWGVAGALPILGVSVNASNNVNDQTQNPSTFLPIATQSMSVAPGAQLQWRLFDGFGMFAAKDRLELLSAQAEGNAELMVESTVQAVLTAYDNVLVQEESANVLRAALSLTRDRLARIETAVRLGSSGTFDRLQFDNALLNDSTALLRQESAVRAARRNLNLLLVQDEERHGRSRRRCSTLWHRTGHASRPACQPAARCRTPCFRNNWPRRCPSGPIAHVPRLGIDRQLNNALTTSGTDSPAAELLFNPYADGDITTTSPTTARR